MLVCDLSQDRLSHIKRLYPHVSVCTDYLEIVNGPNIDAVCIATPVKWHFEMSKRALEAGKHVLVEKPLTICVEEAEELVAIAQKQGLVLLVDHTFEYAPAVNKIKSIIQQGDLGDIHYVSMSRLNLGIFQRDINVVQDLAPHDISILNYVLSSQPTSVSATGSGNILPDIEDVAMVTLRYPTGVDAFLQVSWLDPCKTRRATFVGSSKMLVYDDIEQLEKIKVYDKGVSEPKYYDTFGEFQLSYRHGDIHTPYIENLEPLQVECQHFIHCIEGRETPKSDGKVGLDVVRVLEAAQRSLKNDGVRVEL